MSTIDTIRNSHQGLTISEGPPTPENIWADGGTDVTLEPDERLTVIDHTGGVGVPGSDATVVTRSSVYITPDESVRADSIELQNPGYDRVPLGTAFDTAAAFALAAACVQDNHPTPDTRAVHALARRFEAMARDVLGGEDHGQPCVNHAQSPAGPETGKGEAYGNR